MTSYAHSVSVLSTVLLRERHHTLPGMDDDFNIRHPVALANAAADSAREMETLLASIASIALVVGGIGRRWLGELNRSANA